MKNFYIENHSMSQNNYLHFHAHSQEAPPHVHAPPDHSHKYCQIHQQSFQDSENYYVFLLHSSCTTSDQTTVIAMCGIV